jgi:ATP-dependent Lhr-like helicase
VLRVYCAEREIAERSAPQDRLHPQLVQAVAMIRLLLDGWCEPPAEAAYHLSTLVQQALSFLRERGGARAQDAWTILCKTGPFANVTSSLFADFLRDLKRHDLVMQMDDGTLVLGEGGEKLTDHYSFFCAFQTQEEWTITTEGRTLGTLPIEQPLMPGLFIVFAGRRWRVVNVDAERRDVFVLPAPGGRPPQFGGEGGFVHDRVREEMRAVLLSAEMPVYLDARARELLAEARGQFARLGLVEQGFVEDGNSTVWFPWIGDRVMNTLVVELMALGMGAMRDGVAITVRDVGRADLVDVLRRIAARGPADPVALAATVPNKLLEKHDVFLRAELLDLDYAAKRLDTEGAHRAALDAARDSRNASS